MSLFYDYQDSFLLSRVNVHSMWTYLYTLTSRNKKTYHTPPNPPHFALVFFCAKRFFNLRRMIFQSAANDFPFCTDLFVPVKLVFNKIDRYNNEDQRALECLIELYTSIGYPCSTLCARTEEGLDALKADLKDKITLLSGHSGVGKSTIINKLVPGVNLRTGDISEYHNKGMHTTTFSEMIPLPGGGYLIDTPGIKGFGTIEMADAEISHYFRELFKYSEECRFNNCTHRHEPGCAVIQAVNDGLISESRYKSYLSILDDRMESKYREEF